MVTSGDGIAKVEGLPSAMANELLEFENGTRGIALNLDVRDIGVVVLGDSQGIEEGSTVKRTGEVLSVPVGDGYLGRVVDAMGIPIDGLGDLTNVPELRALELLSLIHIYSRVRLSTARGRPALRASIRVPCFLASCPTGSTITSPRPSSLPFW